MSEETLEDLLGMDDDFPDEVQDSRGGGDGWVQPSFRPLCDLDKIWGASGRSIKELRDNPRRVAIDLLRLFISRRIPITLWGPVGARKTRTIEAFAREKDENGVPYQVITIQPSTEDPTVIHGILYTTLDADSGETVMRKSIPEVAMQVMRYWEQYRGLTIMFLDELTTALPAQQAALLGILTHGKYGELDISPYIAIAMAANPEGTVSTVMPLSEAIINRGGHIAWYGDVNLFLEEWSSGFGSPEREPDPEVEWYIRTYLGQDVEKAFRKPVEDGGWDPENLVPYELMEHTERSTTELAVMIGLINQLFSECPDPVRHFYIVECARALQGNEWADHMKNVTAMEAKRIDGSEVIKIIRSAGVGYDWDIDDLKSALGDRLYELKPGRRIGQDRIIGIASDIAEIVQREDKDFHHAYLSMWAFASLAPDEGTEMSLHSYLTKTFTTGARRVKEGKMDRELIRPSFVSESTRQAIAGMVKRLG